MYIHTVKQGENLYSIARSYGTAAVKIAENNGLGDPDKICAGQQLLILTPTRTYTVRGGDTLEKISKRFGVARRAILQNNPYLLGRDRTYPEEIIALKYDSPTHGAAPVNGYMYRGCTEDRLSLAMPYINYLTISAYRAESGRIFRIFDDTAALRLCKEMGKIPLMRICDKRRLSDMLSEKDAFISRIVSLVRGRGYKGATLAAFCASEEDGFDDLLLCIKRKFIDEGLLLFVEKDANKGIYKDNAADATVLFYEKCHYKSIPTFEGGERKIYSEYAQLCDTGKTFMDFSPFAYSGECAITQREAERIAYNTQNKIEYDSTRKICKFDYNEYARGGKRSVSVAYESLENIKAKLDLISELGFMGMSFDIMRAPVAQIIMMATTYSLGADYLSSCAEM